MPRGIGFKLRREDFKIRATWVWTDAGRRQYVREFENMLKRTGMDWMVTNMRADGGAGRPEDEVVASAPPHLFTPGRSKLGLRERMGDDDRARDQA